ERADAAWLSGLISDLEAQPQVLRRLEVQANSLGFRRGTEWIVPCRPAAAWGPAPGLRGDAPARRGARRPGRRVAARRPRPGAPGLAGVSRRVPRPVRAGSRR